MVGTKGTSPQQHTVAAQFLGLWRLALSSNYEQENRIPAIICALLLVAAVFGHWPYGFYTLLRVVVCAISIYLAVRANSAKSVPWTWVLGSMAVLFNPVLPIRMPRSDWRFVDALAAITFIVFVAAYKPRSYHPHTKLPSPGPRRA